MIEKRTPLQTYAGPDFAVRVEKWWVPILNSEVESYVGVGISFIDFQMVPNSDEKIVLLSKEKTQALIQSLQLAIGG